MRNPLQHIGNHMAAYPLFALVRDIVTAPETLNDRVDDYLKQLRETKSCAI